MYFTPYLPRFKMADLRTEEGGFIGARGSCNSEIEANKALREEAKLLNASYIKKVNFPALNCPRYARYHLKFKNIIFLFEPKAKCVRFHWKVQILAFTGYSEIRVLNKVHVCMYVPFFEALLT